jgi:hypothetical protein
MKTIIALLFASLIGLVVLQGLAINKTTHALALANADVTSLAEQRDRAILANVANIKRLDRCVKQTDANGIDLNGNLVFDRSYEAAREAKMKVKP